MKHNKKTLGVRIDSELFDKATHIIQNKLNITYTKFIENKFHELIREHRK